MKAAVFLFFVFLFSLQLQAQVYKTDKLNDVIKQCYADSVKKIERLAALKFHKMINDYRKKNRLDTLVWDDTLWLASRNHCAWMIANNKLSHHQQEKTPMFTGISPGNRYKYVTSDKGTASWSGENALYNFSDNGSGIDEISATMAKVSFEQWKNSPGHDENMRAKASKSHGTAFLIEQRGTVWATDLFSYDRPEKPALIADAKYEKEKITVKSVQPEKKVIENKPKVKRLNTTELEKLKTDLLLALENKSTVKKSKSMKKAASRHADYLSFSKKLEHEEKKNKPGYYAATVEQRMMKATLGFYFFSRKNLKLNESIAMIETSTASEKHEMLAGEIHAELEKRKNIKGTIRSTAYGIALKQAKGSLKIYAVCLTGFKPEAEIPSDFSRR